MKLLFADYFPWGIGPKVGNHHYARFFLDDGYEVFWLSHYLNYHRLYRRNEDDRQFTTLWRRGLHRGDDGVWSLTPLAIVPYLDLPLLRSAWLGRRTLAWTAPSVRHALRSTGFSSPDVFWTNNVRTVSVLRCMNEPGSIVYRMSDLTTGFRGNPASIARLEEELCRKATVVFATAKSLVERARRWTDRVVYLPNGVHPERFRGPHEEPEDMKRVPSPRCIYVGAIGDWFDTDVLEQAARERPDLHFVLIGGLNASVAFAARIERGMRRLAERSNVHLLGFRDPAVVPAYLTHADVGLIPFLANSHTHAISPIKLYEYAAAGLPVVSRRLEETASQESPTLFYETTDQFVAQLDCALSEKDRIGAEMIAFAEANTWRARYETIRGVLSEHGVCDPVTR